MKPKLLIISVLILTGVCIAGATRLYGSPQYTAEAEYSINWNQMGLGDEDYKPRKARRQYDNQIANLKVGSGFIQELCQECNIPAAEAGSVVKDVQQHLTVTRIGKLDNKDLYRIKCSNSDTNIAVKAVNILSRRLVERINEQHQVEGGLQTFSSFRDRESGDEKQQNLRNQLADLSQEQHQQYSAERQERIQDIQGQLTQNEVTDDLSGLKAFVYLVATLSEPAEIQKRGLIVDPH